MNLQSVRSLKSREHPFGLTVIALGPHVSDYMKTLNLKSITIQGLDDLRIDFRERGEEQNRGSLNPQ